jgi:hypothetical protein
MNDAEQRAEIFLRHQGYRDILHHPHGQHGQLDFLVEGRIAVEVRRLNRNFEGNKGNPVGFESDLITLRDGIKKLALSFGPPTQGQSWLLTLEFHRPAPQWRNVRRRLRQALQGFVDGSHANTRIPLGSGLVSSYFR